MNALRKKIRQLVYGDDGAALVITLALFMLLYIACAGVFAIGQTVKEKMILQNAVDAAAYSAAIVQADTLSRIATLNREMALTYKSMVCRQMDYIVCKWLEDASVKYLATNGKSDLNGNKDHVSPLDSSHSGAPVDVADYSERAKKLLERIKGDSVVISNLNVAIRGLLSNYKDRVNDVVKDVLTANLPANYLSDCYWNVKLFDYDIWARKMQGSEEEKFLDFVYKKTSEYGNSYEQWFDVTDELKHKCDGDFFVSHWITDKGEVSWSYDHTPLNADFNMIVPAEPYFLIPEFYDSKGRKGAISVGVAKYNRNPWTWFVKTGLDGKKRGLYEVFQPLVSDGDNGGAIDWTWAIASAQAGYIDRPEDESARKWRYTGIKDDGKPDEEFGKYRVDWKDGDWNLRTDNWDAVYVPVCQSFTPEEFTEWITGESAWRKLAPELAEKVGLPDYSLGKMSGEKSKALPNMHNGGATKGGLKWEELLDKICH